MLRELRQDNAAGARVKRLIISSDGASKGNPGDAGIGVVVTAEDGTVLREIGEYIGCRTNNYAEYAALIRGLAEAAKLGAEAVSVRTDSELLVRQINGLYRVKSPNIKPLHDKVMALLGSFRSYNVSHVYREMNSRADCLANEGVRKHAANRNQSA